MKNDMKLFCFGYGYVADHLSKALKQDQNVSVLATTRDTIKRAHLKSAGIQTYLFEDSRPLFDPDYALEGVTHILLSIPPKDFGDPVFEAHYEAIKQLPSLKWIGYLSATSVYGDRGGAEVFESDESKPTSKRGSRRLKAEDQWRRGARIDNLPVHIFRLAGIYGPGRNALDSIRVGMARRISKPGHAFNRVHIDDIVQVLKASMESPDAGSVYNVSDDNPAESQEVTAYAANLLGVEPPPLVALEDANLPPMARSFYNDNKRINNDKIKKELGVDLLYPDYRAGLQACLEAEDEASLFAEE